MKAERTFLICGFPRSRTAWLANLLTWGSSFCHHELSGRVRSLGHMVSRMQHGAQCVGNADSAQLLELGELRQALPVARLVLVHRPMFSALDAFCEVSKLSTALARPLFERLQAQFDHHRDAGIVVAFDDLDDEATVRQVWEHCIGDIVPWSQERWNMLRDLNVQQKPSLIRQAAGTES